MSNRNEDDFFPSKQPIKRSKPRREFDYAGDKNKRRKDKQRQSFDRKREL